MAAAAFRSGTDSVELLKKQVAAQRKELEEVKLNHGLVKLLFHVIFYFAIWMFDTYY